MSNTKQPERLFRFLSSNIPSKSEHDESTAECKISITPPLKCSISRLLCKTTENSSIFPRHFVWRNEPRFRGLLHSNSNKVQWCISTHCPLNNVESRSSSIHSRGERILKRRGKRKGDRREPIERKKLKDKERIGKRGGEVTSRSSVLVSIDSSRSTLVIGVSTLFLVPFGSPSSISSRQTHLLLVLVLPLVNSGSFRSSFI